MYKHIRDIFVACILYIFCTNIGGLLMELGKYAKVTTNRCLRNLETERREWSSFIVREATPPSCWTALTQITVHCNVCG